MAAEDEEAVEDEPWEDTPEDRPVTPDPATVALEQAVRRCDSLAKEVAELRKVCEEALLRRMRD